MKKTDSKNKKGNFPLTVLVFLDGWGLAPPGEYNIISRAEKPFFDHLAENYPAGALAIPAKTKLNQENIYKKTGSLPKGLARPGAASIGQYLAEKGLRQYRLGLSENIGLLLGFFDQGRLEIDAKYQVKIISSPLAADMDSPAAALRQLSAASVEIIKNDQADFIAVNFPSPAAYAASGELEPVLKGLAETDNNLKIIAESVLDQKGTVFVLGGFGCLEQAEQTAEDGVSFRVSANPVPLIVAARKHLGVNLPWANRGAGDLGLAKAHGTILDFSKIFLDLSGA